ncbi:DUF1178 family protein [Rhizobacter sp. Root404]|jgi:hypothetical protein|uniref:DUF1178 family protein n=1 Tax=Rhizobacter sp. Root404 TaxID=1736528 RepID=UPI0006FA68A0|nr:DUF1178 family protein [Rhizobacter sp. Root404]KQW36291.1 hypothetical protein ASC76_16480 [Rhizobacter sp. Root404]
MKVLNLRCAREHRFEGWFASDADFVAQGERGLIACPLCEDKAIVRLPSAPRLNVSTPRGDAVGPPPAASEIAQARAQGRWLRAVRDAIASTEDVGDRFPEEARRIHYGEAQERGIRGRASAEDAEALRDEGIEIVTVALPESLKNPVQ